ncbi:hypothetical protein [Streptomyces sp. NPDC059371]|uniref:hypothetical protein n=1 Tax=Streptomyces sp. NPDC059371 TaxID=3346812 RepID=UPI0036AE65F7
MELRPGNAGANTVADHGRVLASAREQIPDSSHAKILVRVDGAGATHGLLKHLEALNTARRKVRYTVGWKMTGLNIHEGWPQGMRLIVRRVQTSRRQFAKLTASSPSTTSITSPQPSRTPCAFGSTTCPPT